MVQVFDPERHRELTRFYNTIALPADAAASCWREATPAEAYRSYRERFNSCTGYIADLVAHIVAGHRPHRQYLKDMAKWQGNRRHWYGQMIEVRQLIEVVEREGIAAE